MFFVKSEITFFDNPNEWFIMSSSSTHEVIFGITEEDCRYGWNCTNWGECLSGKQVRTCTNIGTCSDTYKVMEINRNCTFTVLEIEGEIKKDFDEFDGYIEKKQRDIEKVNGNEVMAFFCFVIILVISFVILYLKKDYFKKLINP